MKFLSDSTIEESLTLCIDNPRYMVGVAVHDSGIGYGAILRVESLIADKGAQDDISRIYKQVGNSRIELKNGSAIYIFTANESSRGKAFHEIVVDKNIDKEIIDMVLIPTEKMQYTTCL